MDRMNALRIASRIGTLVAGWRERAEDYRVNAAACTSASTQLAYQALAEFADGVAGRVEHGTLTRPKLN